MSMSSARAALSSEFTTAWAAGYPDVPASYENRKFTQPVPSPWIDFNIVETDRMRKNLGTKRFVRSFGMVVLEIYVPEDSGTASLFEMADYIGNAMEEKNIPLGDSKNITTMTSKRNNDGKMEGFYRMTVMVPFWFDEAFDG